MIEWLLATFDLKHRLDVVRPAAVVVEGNVATIVGGAEGLIQKFG